MTLQPVVFSTLSDSKFSFFSLILIIYLSLMYFELTQTSIFLQVLYCLKTICQSFFVNPSSLIVISSIMLLCFIDPRVRKIRNEASSCPGIFSRTLRFYYVASSPGSPLPHLVDGHRKLVGRSAIPARSCPIAIGEVS